MERKMCKMLNDFFALIFCNTNCKNFVMALVFGCSEVRTELLWLQTVPNTKSNVDVKQNGSKASKTA